MRIFIFFILLFSFIPRALIAQVHFYNTTVIDDSLTYYLVSGDFIFSNSSAKETQLSLIDPPADCQCRLSRTIPPGAKDTLKVTCFARNYGQRTWYFRVMQSNGGISYLALKGNRIKSPEGTVLSRPADYIFMPQMVELSPQQLSFDTIRPGVNQFSGEIKMTNLSLDTIHITGIAGQNELCSCSTLDSILYPNDTVILTVLCKKPPVNLFLLTGNFTVNTNKGDSWFGYRAAFETTNKSKGFVFGPSGENYKNLYSRRIYVPEKKEYCEVEMTSLDDSCVYTIFNKIDSRYSRSHSTDANAVFINDCRYDYLYSDRRSNRKKVTTGRKNGLIIYRRTLIEPMRRCFNNKRVTEVTYNGDKVATVIKAKTKYRWKYGYIYSGRDSYYGWARFHKVITRRYENGKWTKSKGRWVSYKRRRPGKDF